MAFNHYHWTKSPILAKNYCVIYRYRNIGPLWVEWPVNTLRPRENGRHFADDIFKRFFLNENVSISIKISLKFIPKGPTDNIPALVQIMAWRRLGDKPLYEPMLVSFLTHICVTRPQWVKKGDIVLTYCLGNSRNIIYIYISVCVCVDFYALH